MTVSARDQRIVQDCMDTDEPTIVFRAQDKLMLSVLQHYRERALAEGATDDFIAAVDQRHKEVTDWQLAHPYGIKTPDLRPGEPTS